MIEVIILPSVLIAHGLPTVRQKCLSRCMIITLRTIPTIPTFPILGMVADVCEGCDATRYLKPRIRIPFITLPSRLILILLGLSQIGLLRCPFLRPGAIPVIALHGELHDHKKPAHMDSVRTCRHMAITDITFPPAMKLARRSRVTVCLLPATDPP